MDYRITNFWLVAVRICEFRHTFCHLRGQNVTGP
jgi:hypothetical protein